MRFSFALGSCGPTVRGGGHFECMGGGDVTIYGIKNYANYDTCIYDEIPQTATWDNSKVGGTAGDDDVTVRYGNNDINDGDFPLATCDETKANNMSG